MLKSLRVGKVLTSHGLKGELKVMPTTDSPERFLKLKKLTLLFKDKSNMPVTGGGYTLNGVSDSFGGELEGYGIELEIESVRFHKDNVLLKFKGLDKIEDVRGLRNCDLIIPRSDSIELSEGEYFLGDYIGLSVRTDEGEDLGQIKDVIETGANLVFVVMHKGKELLIPKSPDCVLDLNMEEGYVLIHLLDGLLEL